MREQRLGSGAGSGAPAIEIVWRHDGVEFHSVTAVVLPPQMIAATRSPGDG